jgi:hypothetical protein
MFYGGRLLAHLSASDDSVSDLISLLSINRYSIVVIDSDKKVSGAEINATKKRIHSEITNAGGIAWVTAGREIENEIPKDIFEKACAKLGQRSAADLDYLFADRMVRADNQELEIDKVKLAKVVAEISTELPENITAEIKRIVEFIGLATLKSV